MSVQYVYKVRNLQSTEVFCNSSNGHICPLYSPLSRILGHRVVTGST